MPNFYDREQVRGRGIRGRNWRLRSKRRRDSQRLRAWLRRSSRVHRW